MEELAGVALLFMVMCVPAYYVGKTTNGYEVARECREFHKSEPRIGTWIECRVIEDRK